MKKILISVTLILTVTLLSAEKLAVVTKTFGDVYYKRASIEEYSPGIPIGTILEEGDQIKTDNGYIVLVMMDDKTQIKLRPNTELSLSADPDPKFYQYRMNINFGTVFTEYEKTDESSFRIVTPTSVASVKGTEFWTISKPLGVDKICVITGIVDVLNNFTGESATVNAGETVKCSSSGELLLAPSTGIPIDPEVEFGTGEPKIEEEQKEPIVEPAEFAYANIIEEAEDSTEVLTKELLTITESEPDPEPETQTEEKEPEEEKSEPMFGENLKMNAGFGAVTLDGNLYNQIALRPDFSLGKLGIGLDVVLYLDQDGNIRKDDWNEFSDFFDKIMYVRWAKQGDPFFVRAGTIENTTLGYGLIMNEYSNSIEYPDVKKLGLHTGISKGDVGIELMISDIKGNSGLMGLRGTYNIGKLKFGGSWISDFNPYLGLTDSDGDYYPDVLDGLPEDKKYWADLDGDGIADEIDPDRDGDGYTDNSQDTNIQDNDPDGVDLLPIPFSIKENRRSLNSLSFDVGYPVFSNDWVNITAYSELGTYFGQSYEFYNTEKNLDTLSYGWGMVMPGLKAKFLKLFDINLEYRRSGGHFVYGLFNQSYDVERVSFIDLSGVQDTSIGLHPITKYEQLFQNNKMSGIFGRASANIFNIASLTFGYQDMNSSEGKSVKGIMGNLNITPSFIPKLKSASAYINRMNVDDPWDIKSEGTMIGYNVSVDIGGGTIMNWIFQRSYLDINGDGEIEGEEETITSTIIETSIAF